MAELQAQQIHYAITAVIPDLPEAVLSSVEDALRVLGAESREDLQYVTEGDLLSVLKPVQARRLVAAWAQSNSTTQTSTSACALTCPSPPSRPSSASSTASSPSRSPVVPDWVDKFQIPWHKLPEELIQILERQKRPSPRLRREMIRVVVSEIVKLCKNPTKRNTTEIGKRMVAKYPQSLQDVIEGDIIGAGYHSLVKQLQARIDNVKRPDTPKIKKRKVESDGNETEEIPESQKASVQDTYGCINWELKYLPLSETVESQLEKKEKMKKMFEEMENNTNDIKHLVQVTFYMQRKDINKGTSIQQLGKEWPFLFQETGMAAHFQELTGVTLLESFLANVDKKGKRLLNFFENVDAQKCKKVLDTLLKLQTGRGQHEGCSGELIQMILLLLAHFGEQEGYLFHFVEETCLAPDVQRERLPATPTIIVCGTSCFAARMFMLSIDRQIVNDHITSFLSALCLMFGSYYCFNIHYPVELRSTLEFLQRCFFSINPERGTKVEWNKNKKVLPVNPRVLTLISDLADHEWM
ncbi:hypothetical protein GJAV_G00059270 [Gymnothorax javanicus]|nr:hypothetical protein GJAV_G00059270 [Gymnothorax javanicus]